MTKTSTNRLILFLFFFVFVSSQKSFSQCFQIESILVAACSPPGPTTEGYNEMVRFKVGATPLNVNNLNVSWPSNGWEGLVQNAATAAKVATLNAAIDAAGGCGNLLEPVGGVLPANASVILVTSYLMDASSNSFGALAEDTYIIFQDNPGTTGGHFGNYNATPGTRTLSMTFTGAGGCTDSVTYQRASLSNSAGATVLFTPAGAATYVNYGCTAPVPPFTVDAGTTPISACPGSTISLSGTAQGQQSVSWTAPSGTFSASTNLSTTYTVAANTAGQTITITLTATNACGTSITDTVTLNVTNASPTVASFTYPTPNCVGAAPIMPTLAAGFTPGGTFSSNANLSLNALTGEINIAASTSGSHTILYSVTADPSICRAAGSGFFNIQISNSATPIVQFSYPSSICVNSSPVMPTLAPGFVTGGTFSSDPGLSINPTTGEINVAASTAAAHNIIYNVAANPASCQAAGTHSFPIQITNFTTPVTTFTYPAQVCANSSSVSPSPATGFTTGGIYSSSPGLNINATTGVINVGASTPGTYIVKYEVVATGCQNTGSSTFPIEITNAINPVVSFSYPVSVCENSTSVMPILDAGFTPGGTFTSDSGLSINPITGEVNPSASTPNPHSVIYTFAADPANCINPGADSALISFNTETVPAVSFSYPAQVCTTSAPIFPSTAPGTTGGTFTSNTGLIIDPLTGEVNVVASTVGSHTITYTVLADPTICQGGDSFTTPFEITSGITPVTGFSYTSPVCSDNAPVNPIPVTDFTTGGVYTSDAGLSINATTGQIDVATSTPGPHTITYTINPDPATCNLGGSNTANFVINVVSTPVTNFSYTTPICGNSPSINPIPGPGFVTGGIYTSDAGLSINATTGVINVAASTTGSHTITYTINPDPANCNLGGNDTFSVFITPIVTPITDFSYQTPICSDNTPISPIPAAGFTPGGIYTSDAGLSINAATGVIDIATSTVGTHTITYTINPDPATCNVGGSDTFPIVINAVFTPVTDFSYATPICPDSTPVNPIPGAGFTGGGVFSSDAGLSINPTTGQINVTASTLGAHNVTYTILPNAATCNQGNSTTFPILIDAGSAIAPITGSTAVCVGETIQLSNATPGGTWSSSDPSIATVDSSGLVTGVTSNYVDIIYTVNNTCVVSVKSNITVYANPNPLLENKYLCVSNISGVPYNSVLLECGIPNANFTFVWTLDGAPLPTTTNAHLATELGVYEVTVTNTVSGCTATTSCTVSASSTAVATATVSEDFNQNQTIVVNVTGGSGDYLFQLDHGVPQESNIFPYAHQGEYTITVIDKNGCQDLELTVFALNYPRFFTPNGDGYNDTWGIKGLTDLKAKAFIFDRFGKLIKYLNAFGEEWDGTYNGEELPSTDYWFLLEYKNKDGLDKEFKAHFSLKR